MFKKLAVFSLFSFVSIVLSNPDISQLREELLKKQLELSDLGLQIEQREIMFDQMTKESTSLFDSLTEQRRNEIMDQVAAFIERFNDASVKGEIKSFLMHEFCNDAMENWDTLARAKSLLIRRLVEREILKQLLYRYAEQLEVITTMNLELLNYEKN